MIERLWTAAARWWFPDAKDAQDLAPLKLQPRTAAYGKRLAALASCMLAGATLWGCGETANLTVAQGTGPRPELPAPSKTLLPTVNIAPATGWPQGAAPQAAAGLQVEAFASGLDHPRWLLVLPNGDVLVAESNAPPKPDGSKSIREYVMALVMKRAGAGTPSANRISLL
ncbi:MAG TPA: hypothetical protein VET87_22915, partial [Rubrivivax sp.]|nr:hypothetical protein [Rubrivivax sp.]